VDEYALEIDALRRTLARLRAEQADALLIEEYEVELRNLRALYAAATETAEAGAGDPRLRHALSDIGFGDWTLDNVYSFVYEASLEADGEGRELSAIVNEIDFAASLLAALGEPA
jgi:hypothetical protein